mmetsp:Transcript_5510/g.16639  ORF Transcript_5510/g.16639 Transcript_5510/m.16639 type:complete len:222 (-) Transcript_5510:159-824(-)
MCAIFGGNIVLSRVPRQRLPLASSHGLFTARGTNVIISSAKITRHNQIRGSHHKWEKAQLEEIAIVVGEDGLGRECPHTPPCATGSGLGLAKGALTAVCRAASRGHPAPRLRPAAVQPGQPPRVLEGVGGLAEVGPTRAGDPPGCSSRSGALPSAPPPTLAAHPTHLPGHPDPAGPRGLGHCGANRPYRRYSHSHCCNFRGPCCRREKHCRTPGRCCSDHR